VKYTDAHRWAAAVWLVVTDRQAAHATRRGTVRVDAHENVEVVEIACGACRRSYEVAAGQPCEAAGQAWREAALIGGPAGHRKPRTSALVTSGRRAEAPDRSVQDRAKK
jgi:hypothetical protein